MQKLWIFKMRIILLILILLFPFHHLAQAQKWYEGVVFYEIFVRSFYDSNGDGIGDLKGIIKKLDYLNWLGVKGIWLMPINPSPSYHGYDVTDYYNINPQYGTLDDFKKLLEEAHKRGIRIIIDLVLNHTSSRHEWFLRSERGDEEYKDFYVWSESIPEGEWRRPWGGEVNPMLVWCYSATRRAYYYAAFWCGMPDLNYKNEKVKQKAIEIIKYWLKLGVDGFRFDAGRYMIEEGPFPLQADTPSTIKLWQEFYSNIVAVNPDAYTVGEIWLSDYYFYQDLAKYYTPEKPTFHQVFDFPMLSVASSSLSINGTYPVLAYLSNRQKYENFLAPILENHDVNRFFSSIGMDWDRAKLGTALLLTIPGTPFIYYGQEIGMIMGYRGGDERKRSPMQWDNSKYAGFSSKTPWYPITEDLLEQINVKTQKAKEDSLLNQYRKFISLRNNYEALKYGKLKILDNSNPKKVLTFLRYTDDQYILVALNFSPKEDVIYVDLEELYNTLVKRTGREVFQVTNLLTGLTQQKLGKDNSKSFYILIGPREAKILKFDKI